MSFVATELQKPNNDFDDHEDEFDEWIMCNEFGDLEETVSCLIDSSPFAATPQSNPITWFEATPPQSDPLTSFDIEEQQQRLELKVEIKQQQPQQFMDKQEEYFPQEHESTKLILQDERFITKQKSATSFQPSRFW